MLVNVSVLLALAAAINATVLDHISKRDAGLEVTLTEIGNAEVKAVVKNVGDKALKLFTYGTIFDAAPVEKISVYSGAEALPFGGVLRTVEYTNLAEEVFYTLEAGATYETDISAAATYDLETGKYTVTAEGAFAYAEAGSSDLSKDAVTYKSNTLELQVDGEAAKKVRRSLPALAERTIIQSSCTGTRRTSTLNAYSSCVTRARLAATAATSGSATLFNTFFKTTAAATRSRVSARFSAIATECGSSTSGRTTYYCTDPYGYCSSNTVAYAIPSLNLVNNCPIFFNYPTSSAGCSYGIDGAGTTIHEFTHTPAVYSPGTQDNAYGYAASTRLTSAQALDNADNFALYAKAVQNGCS